jgi:hypothetical protein
MDKIGHSPIIIFDVDKTYTTLLEGKNKKVTSLRGKKQVAALTPS